MLILSVVHSPKWTKLIDKWEFDVVNSIERISHTLDNMIITNFIENLSELLNSWKINYPGEYQNMIDMADNRSISIT